MKLTMQLLTVLMQPGTIENGNGPIAKTAESSLAHELRHLYSYDQSIYNNERLTVPNYFGGTARLTIYELRAVRYENIVRKRLGLPTRRAYLNDYLKPAAIPNAGALPKFL